MDIKEYANTVENEDGTLRAEAAADVPEGKREGVKVTKFEESHVDEKGNIIVTGRSDAMPKEGKVNAKIVAQFSDTIEGEDGNLHAVKGPDVG